MTLEVDMAEDGSPSGDATADEILADTVAGVGGNGTDTDRAGTSQEDEDEFDAERAKQAIHKKNQENRTLRDRLKALEPLAKKAQELEDANKSDLEKVTGDRDNHKTRADAAEQEAMRLRVALAKGLNLSQAKRLIGSTEEELETDADELLASFGAGNSKPKVPGKPKPNLKGGGEPDEPVEETDPKKLAELIRRR